MTATLGAVAEALADAHRREWAFVLAATVRVAGDLYLDLDLAEGCAQEAYVDALQCEYPPDEVAFVAGRVNDPLTIQAATAVTDQVAVRTRRPAWSVVVTIEGS